MSRSNNSGLFFQTSDGLATEERKAAKAKNKHGDPIKLPSKLLSLITDLFDNDVVYVAEAAGEVKRVRLDTSEVTRTSNQAAAPLTSLAICTKTRQLFSGCWDKNIYASTLEKNSNSSQSTRKVLASHTDFVKCLLTTSLDGTPILVSGGADSSIVIWNTATLKPIHKLKLPTKASLQDLALDPLSLPEGSGEPKDSFILFTASSDREIRRWHISLDSAHELPESIAEPILAHETSVYKLRFDSEGDLWTASADKTAKHLVRSRGWEADTVLQHPDFVRDVVLAEQRGLVATACRDEEVRVWDAGSGDLLCTYSGHFEEVTGLAVVGDEAMLVSVSIDGTVRRWGLERKEMARYLEDLKQEDEDEEAKEGGAAENGGGMLTAEEEAELAELMEDE